MKFKILLFLSILNCMVLCVQASNAQQPTEDIYTEYQVDKIPTYQGKHISASKMWFLNSFSKYQDMLPKELIIKFIIEPDGGVHHVEPQTDSKRVKQVVERVFMKPPHFGAAIKNGKAVRYEISYTITRGYSDGGNGSFVVLSVYNAESYIHTINEIETLPTSANGAPLVEYLDFIMSGVAPAVAKLENPKNGFKFNLVCRKDGAVNIAVVKSKPSSAIMKMVTRRVAKFNKITPAQSGGRSVSYVNPVVISIDRVKQLSALSFSEEAKQNIAQGEIFDCREVTQLPLYDGGAFDVYSAAVREQIFSTTPKMVKAKGSVSLEIEITKEGKVSNIKIVDSSSKKLSKAVTSAISQVENRWSPAQIYSNNVDCKAEIKIVFEGSK